MKKFFSSSTKALILLFLVSFAPLKFGFAQNNTLPSKETLEKKQTPMENIGVTIYSTLGSPSQERKDPIAAIHEVRQFPLSAGKNRITIDGLSASILPESFFIHIVNPGFKVEILEQSFSGNPFSFTSLLAHSVGKEVFVRATGSDINRANFHRARLLTIDPQVIIEEEGKVYSVKPDQLVFIEQVAANDANSSLSITLESPKAQVVPVEVNYLTKGFEWVAYYIGELNQNESSINIDGWVSINNRTSSQFTNAQVQLSAFNPLMGAFDNHDSELGLLYRIENPVTLGAYQDKKVRLFRIINLPLVLDYRFKALHDFSQHHMGQEIPASVEKWGTVERPVEFREIIPEGQLRLYKRNEGDGIEFLGETTLKERGSGKRIPFLIGNAKEVKVMGTQTDFKQLYHNVYEAGYLYTFLNKSESPIDVKIFLKLSQEGKLLKESLSHENIDEETLQWSLHLPPSKAVEFRYRIRVPVSDSMEKGDQEDGSVQKA